jgi:hypothetical protein
VSGRYRHPSGGYRPPRTRCEWLNELLMCVGIVIAISLVALVLFATLNAYR